MEVPERKEARLTDEAGKGPEQYSIDEVIRVPIELEDENGVAHVKAIFWRIKNPASVGPRGLNPDDTLELRGNGEAKTRAVVETTLKVNHQHAPGTYVCVAIQVYDALDNTTQIRNPEPYKVLKISANGDEDKRPGARFLSWR